MLTAAHSEELVKQSQYQLHIDIFPHKQEEMFRSVVLAVAVSSLLLASLQPTSAQIKREVACAPPPGYEEYEIVPYMPNYMENDYVLLGWPVYEQTQKCLSDGSWQTVV